MTRADVVREHTKFVLGWLHRTFVAAHPSVTDPESRRHAELSATLLVTLIPIGIGIAGLPVMLSSGRRFSDDWDLRVVTFAALFWLAAYALARFGRYAAGSGLAAATALVAIVVASTIDDIDDDNMIDILYVMMPVLFSSVVHRTRTTLALAGAAIGGVLLLPQLKPSVTYAQLAIGPLSFALIGCGLVMLGARHRDLIERDRRAALADSEARHRGLFEAAFGAIAVVRGGRLIETNPGFRSMFDCGPTTPVDRPLTDFVAPEFRERVQESLETGSGPWELVGLRCDGSRVPMELVVNVQRSGPHCIRTVAFRDITERKRAETELLRAQRLDSVGLLAGGVAHDFNNLLTSILGNGSLALDLMPDRDPVRGNIEKAMASAGKARELTQQLLAYAGASKSRKTVFDLNRLVRESQSLVQSASPRKGWLEFELGENLPPIEGDRSQVQQVLMNLILNASEATPDGAIQIRTSHRRIVTPADSGAMVGGGSLPPDDYTCIEVCDEGHGMTSETLARIFEPFFTTKMAGHGLGLSAALGIVRGHGGGIAVQSAIGLGTVFQVLLPAATKPARLDPLSQDAQAPLRGSVLVVDDDDSVREFLAEALDRVGLQVHTAASGREAIERFKALGGDVSAVVLDVQMPGLDGSQVYEQLVGVDPEVNVLFSSGYRAPASLRDLIDDGSVGFLPKPFTPSELTRSLGKALRRSQLRAGRG